MTLHQNLTNGKVSKKELIEFSFKFLLEREPNTSILSSFELSVISGYFPEYIKTVKEWSTKKLTLDFKKNKLKTTLWE